ncbi:MAG: hypothetical protein AB1758_30470 [Candidatus Eremiobacterota bacterium]
MMINGSIERPSYLPLRASGQEAAAPAEPTSNGYDVKGVATEALRRMMSGDARTTAHVALGEIAQKAGSPVDRKYAETLRNAAAVMCFPETATRIQGEALQALGNGLRGTLSQELGKVGAIAMSVSKAPDEGYRIGTEIVRGVADAGQTPAEAIVGKATLNAATTLAIDYQTWVNFYKGAFEQLQNGVTGTPEQAIGQLGLTLPAATQHKGDQALGEACNIGASLHRTLAQTTQNPTAKAIADMSAGHSVATEGLKKAQQEGFADLVAGRTSQYVRAEGSLQYLTPNKNAIASAVGGLAIQTAMFVLGSMVHPFVGYAAGAVGYMAVKGVYHGLMEANARKNGAQRYDQDKVNSAFSDGFKYGMKGNILSGLLHTGINATVAGFLGAPASFVVGPAVSGLLGRFGL